MKAKRVVTVIAATVLLGAVLLGGLAYWRLIHHDESARPRGALLAAETGPETHPAWPVQDEVPVAVDFAASNVVSAIGAMDHAMNGVIHLWKERDGRTTVETLNGVACRYLNRRPEKKFNGYLYFGIDPSFKSRELRMARIEIEYFVSERTHLRLQYDATDGNQPKPYKTIMATGGEIFRFGNVPFTRVQASNDWQTATFHITNGAFLNSQNGGADFRLEVDPPEIYVRRVTVFREGN